MSEKLGGRPQNLVSLEEFNTMINDCGIIDCGYEGSKYTWSNNQEGGGFVWARLDRVFTNPAWADVFSSTMVKDLPRSTSDHSPMLIQIDEGVSFHPSSFKCQNMWIPRLLTWEYSWNLPAWGSPFDIFFQRLQSVKQHLKIWNKDIFGNIFDNVKKVEDKLLQAQIALEHCWTDGN